MMSKSVLLLDDDLEFDVAGYRSLASEMPYPKDSFSFLIFDMSLGCFPEKALGYVHRICTMVLPSRSERYALSAWLTASLFLFFVTLASIIIAAVGSTTPNPYLLIWGLALLSLAVAFVLNWGSTNRQKAESSLPRNRIQRAPGTRLMEVADFFFSKKTVEGVYAPMIADLQMEYVDALAQSRPRKAAWIRIRGCWSFWNTFALQSLVSTAQKVYSLWKIAQP